MDNGKQQEVELTCADGRTIIFKHLKELCELRCKYEVLRIDLNGQENSFSQEISKKRSERSQLKQKIQQLSQENNKIKEKIAASKKLPCELVNRHDQIERDKQMCVHKEYVKMVLSHIKPYLSHLLICSSMEVIDDARSFDITESYKVYGLLLSACKLKQRKPEDAIVEKVLDMTESIYKRNERHIIKDHVVKAVDLTHIMLTLLPPLIVTTHLKDYNEQAHEIKTTRDEFDKRRRQLLYYRPILVHGNQLHVATKGLVGNVEKDAMEEPHCQQGHEQQQQQQQRDREQKELERHLRKEKKQKEQEQRQQLHQQQKNQCPQGQQLKDKFGTGEQSTDLDSEEGVNDHKTHKSMKRKSATSFY